MDKKIKLFAHTRDSFTEAVYLRLGKGRQQAKALYTEWYKKGLPSSSNPCFSNCPKLYQDILNLVDATLPETVDVFDDTHSKKVLLKMGEHDFVETVILSMQNGSTQCISSQVGCKMGCGFCETAMMGLKRQLLTEEIVAQVFIAEHRYQLPIRNIVFMGMGEPFDNFDAVMQAFDILSDQGGLALGERRITVSTSGLADKIELMADRQGAKPELAVSINSALDSVRKKIMPVNRKFNLERLKQAMEYYCDKTRREIFVEYVLLEGVNDSDKDAKALLDYLDGLPVKINLIPYNPQLSLRFMPPTEERMLHFAEILKAQGHRVLVRHNKGKKIMAACGQLSIKHHQKEKLIQMGSTQEVKTA